MGILVVGSVALDSLQTPFGKMDEALGGSATYFSISASFFNKVDIIAVVGEDFPRSYLSLFRKRGIGLRGLEVKKGAKTFRWKGRYGYDLNTAHTIYTRLNVFQSFSPKVPPELKKSRFVFLANIDPDLQHNILDQIKRPRFVACDSMNYWIENKIKSLRRLLDRVDLLLLNDAEARQLSGKSNLLKAAQLIVSFGPKAVVIKRGEHGALYYSNRSHFVAPAYILEEVYDPTGAGDTFAGGMMGFLSTQRNINESTVRKAIIYGTIMASFVVEDFSVNRLLGISTDDIKSRYAHFRKITRY